MSRTRDQMERADSLLPEPSGSFYVARQCMTGHCYALSRHIVGMMARCGPCAFEPFLIVPKKEVGESQPAMCKETGGSQRATGSDDSTRLSAKVAVPEH